MQRHAIEGRDAVGAARHVQLDVASIEARVLRVEGRFANGDRFVSKAQLQAHGANPLVGQRQVAARQLGRRLQRLERRRLHVHREPARRRPQLVVGNQS